MTRRLGSLIAALAFVALVAGGPLVAGLAAAGPPYPEPVEGQRIYDTAGLWSASAEAEADRIIRAIEDRTAAQVVVYSQTVDFGISGEEAEAHAAALGNQWGVGRGGFNDGLVILFDIDPGGLHGQVAIVGGDGFRAAYIDDRASKRIIDDEILPHLVGGAPDFDGALLAGLRRVDSETTPQRAEDLQRARLVNAILGVVVAPILALLLVGWTGFNWLRFGKDPVYLDDPSILMPAPPDGLTAATGALVYDGATSRRALTAALLDLASRGELAFEEQRSLLSKKVGILTEGVEAATPEDAARRRLNARRPIAAAERYALEELRGLAPAGSVLDGDDLLKFGTKTGTFDAMLEDHAVSQGWFARPPRSVKLRWAGLGGAEIVAGVAVGVIGGALPIAGLVVVAGASIAAGIVTLIVARWMPARTMAGAMIRAMLAAYRRTLEKTMAQARSMQQVVDEAKLPWLETPDQALVWGVALGLQDMVQEVLSRSLEDLEGGRAAAGTVWFPGWYGSQGAFSGGVAAGSLFSGSAVPDFGGMFSVLGSVGNAPSSSGGSGGGFGGGGGFSGGSSGGF